MFHRRIKAIILISFLLYFIQSPSIAQEASQYVPINRANNALMDYLINSGNIHPHFTLQQPYYNLSCDSIAGYNIQNIFYFMRNKSMRYKKENTVSISLTGADKYKYLNNRNANRYRASGSVYVNYPHVIFYNRTTIDQDYKYDPNYAGDLSESAHWLYGRVNDAYGRFYMDHFNFFIGRTHRNWGPPDSYSLMLSNYAYSYDHVFASYQNKFLKFSLIFTRLENLPAWGQNDPNNLDSLTFYPKASKFLAGHRLDLNFSKNFQVALTEMATYGGPNRDFDLSFVNPMTLYYGLQRNDQKLNDGNWSLDVFYKPKPKITLYGQFMIDDIIVNNEPGQNDRANFPDRLGLNVSIRSGDIFLKGLNISAKYIRIWNRTYQSRWTWENYHYRGLGLGYPCASCEEFKLKIGYWGEFPLFIQDEFIIGRYGHVSLTDVFIPRKEPFPVPPAINNLVNRFMAHYFLNEKTDIFLNVEYFKNPNHYLNRLNQGSKFTFSLGLSHILGLSFFPN